MNKMFTATAALKLIEAGKLSLDDTVGKVLPDYPNKEIAAKVTIRHLLTHTGGTGDFFGPLFTKNRLTLKTHGDYVALFGIARAGARARRRIQVFQLRHGAARRHHRARQRHVVFRLRAHERVRAGRDAIHRLAA